MTQLPIQPPAEAAQTDPSRLETRRIAGPTGVQRPTLVFLHEGLGSVSTWQDFPDRLCQAVGLPGLIYSRQGYGRSPALQHPLNADFLHLAATEELPAVLAAHDITSAVLVGHSDGASIAVVRASQTQRADCRIEALIAIAPHLFVEEICLTAIQRLSDRIAGEPERLGMLAAHHDNPAEIFNAWSQAWLDPQFHQLDLRTEAAAIRCPVLAVQGSADQYGSLDQIRQLASLAAHGQAVVLADCRHSPHLEVPEQLLGTCRQFLESALRA